MRVTFGSLFRNGPIDINRTTEQLAIRQREVSSGRRIHPPSDDPAAMAAAMDERSEMAVLDQGDANVQSVDVARERAVQVTFDGNAILQGSAAADVVQTLEALATAVQTGDMAGIDQGLADVGQAFDRVTNAQTQIGVELARLPEDHARLDTQHRAADARRSLAEDARLTESISAMTQADAAHRAAPGALANAGRLSLMDYLK